MSKLIAQAIGLAAVILLCRRLEFGVWLTAVAAVGGLVLVHVLYDWIYSRLTGHIGAAAISNDDPLMVQAFEEAKRAWPEFQAHWRERPQNCMVKYRMHMKSGDIENVWGDLLELTDDFALVHLRTPPIGTPAGESGPRMQVPVGDVVDWQVVFEDETLRGGFTQQATFRIVERDQGSIPAKWREQLARYRAVEGPAA